jgi:hypothetical protein
MTGSGSGLFKVGTLYWCLPEQAEENNKKELNQDS